LVNAKEYAGIVVAGFLSAVQHKLRQALQNNDLAEARKLVNGGTNGLDTFKIAMAAGRAVIAQAIIQQAQATTRAKKTHRPKHSGHRAHPAHPAAPAKPTR
jgi:predicted chitinase